jgi:hypothetical protein
MPDYPFIPPKTVQKIINLGLSEKDVMDVWQSGENFKFPSGIDAMKKKYKGWGEIGLTYTRRHNGEYVIMGVWSRKRA